MVLFISQEAYKCISDPTMMIGCKKVPVPSMAWPTSSWISIEDIPTHMTEPEILKSLSTLIGFFKTILSTEAVTSNNGLVVKSSSEQCWTINKQKVQRTAKGVGSENSKIFRGASQDKGHSLYNVRHLYVTQSTLKKLRHNYLSISCCLQNICTTMSTEIRIMPKP